jgi:hypothetical protein
MAISVSCPGCGKAYNVKDEAAGKSFRCKQCQGVVSVPAASAASGDPWDDTGPGEFPDQDPYGDDEFGAPPAAPRRRTSGRTKSRRGGTEGGAKDNLAIISLVLGCINLLSWCLPICGFPLSIGGIVCGIVGMGSPAKRTLAIIGLILSVLGLIGSIVNAVIGAMMVMEGNHPLFQQ